MNTQPIPPDLLARLAALPHVLAQSVRGQPEAITALADIVECREREMYPRHGCRSAVLKVGPTGSGKTQMAKDLAQALYGPAHLMRFDVSEFAHPLSLDQALADEPHRQGRLARAYEKVPAGIWLFDEIEKGCPEFKDLLLQMIYEGEVTLASGRTLDFSNIYILATSNLGSREILEREHLPFESLENHVLERMEEWLRPELLARFDALVVFRPLEWVTQKDIVTKRLDELVVWHRDRHQRTITYDSDVVEFLMARGFSPRYGARPLLRTINRMVSLAILHALRNGADGSGHLVIHGEQLRIKTQ
jgi:ATP-dependent Clp protease ATP-binding subunit ClpA